MTLVITIDTSAAVAALVKLQTAITDTTTAIKTMGVAIGDVHKALNEMTAEVEDTPAADAEWADYLAKYPLPTKVETWFGDVTMPVPESLSSVFVWYRTPHGYAYWADRSGTGGCVPLSACDRRWIASLADVGK